MNAESNNNFYAIMHLFQKAFELLLLTLEDEFKLILMTCSVGKCSFDTRSN